MKNNKSSRTGDNEAQERNTRNFHSMNYRNPLAVPPGVMKQGYVYKWINTNIRGEETFRLQTAAQEGWELVPPERTNVRYSYDPLDRNPNSSKVLSYKDVVLMERPAELSEQQLEYQNQLAENSVRNLPGVGSRGEIHVKPHILKQI